MRSPKTPTPLLQFANDLPRMVTGLSVLLLPIYNIMFLIDLVGMIKAKGIYSTTMHPTPESEALSENTPSDRLRELAQTRNKAVRKVVAQNPNTPTDVLLKLFYEFPLQVLNNPVLDLLLLENPNFLEELYQANTSVFSEYELPFFFLEWAVNHSNEDIRADVAHSPLIQRCFLEHLAQDKVVEVRCSVAANFNTPTHILKRLAEDKDVRVRLDVACNCNNSLPLALRKQLLKQLVQDDQDYDICLPAARKLVELLEELIF